jgi:hypothetical protein
LLSNSTRITVTRCSASRPLFFAAANGETAVVKMLLEAGALNMLTCDWEKECVWILTDVRVATQEERGGDVDAAVWASENMNFGTPTAGCIFERRQL